MTDLLKTVGDLIFCHAFNPLLQLKDRYYILFNYYLNLFLQHTKTVTDFSNEQILWTVTDASNGY